MSLSDRANSPRSLAERYFCTRNLFSSSQIWWGVKAVLFFFLLWSLSSIESLSYSPPSPPSFSSSPCVVPVSMTSHLERNREKMRKLSKISKFEKFSWIKYFLSIFGKNNIRLFWTETCKNLKKNVKVSKRADIYCRFIFKLINEFIIFLF